MAQSDDPLATPTDANGSSTSPRGFRRAFLPVGLVVLVVAAIYGVRFWQFAQTHVSTDNAQLASDVILIEPQVGGVVVKVLVTDNQMVKKGDLLMQIDPAPYRAAVQAAQANLDAAIAQAKGAGVSVGLTQQVGTSQLESAEAGLDQATTGIASAGADTWRAESSVQSAKAGVSGAEAAVATAKAGVNAAIAAKARAVAAAASAAAQVDSARAGLSAANASVASAAALYETAQNDSKRYAALAAEGAVSRQLAEQADATAKSRRAALDAAQESVSQARSAITARQAEYVAAQRQIDAAASAIDQAKAQLNGAKQSAAAARSGVRGAEAQYDVARVAVSSAKAKQRQAKGQLGQAQTVPKQVAVSQSAAEQAKAKIEQAQAALKSAQLQLGYTKLFAPADGMVSKRAVEPGQFVAPGTPMIALVPTEIWVVANFKETQLATVKPGQPVEIDVDLLPGHPYKGHVDSIAAATGATFALLPPDNATGNFTKVVQRVPVKIVLDPGQPDIDRLRSGMSVTAIVETK